MKLTVKSSSLIIVVLSLSILGCTGEGSKITATINQSASLIGDLPANPLQWKVITTSIDKSDSTMSTLYGNDLAVQYARTNSQHDYPNGSVLCLVTWSQRADSRWFGAKIPNQVKAVEFVFAQTAGDGRLAYSYQKYEGSPLKKVETQDTPASSNRGAYILSQRAAVMP